MSIHQLPPDVLHILVEMKQHQDAKAMFPGQELNEAFDAIAAWCDAEQLFLGGSLANAVVYAPLRPISRQQMQRLRQLILSQPGVAGCQMKLLLLSYLQSVSEKAACLEAFSQSQRFLAEKLAEGSDALALLAPAGPRCWAASVTQAGAMLFLEHMRLKISLSLIPSDIHEKPDEKIRRVAEFDRFNQQIISLKDVEMFIPDWLDLNWTKVPQHPTAHLSTGRWQAEGHGFQLRITGNPSAQLTHREVMLRWMGVVAVS